MKQLTGISGEEYETWEEEEAMYVLTNKEKLYGAAGILLGKVYFQKVFGKKSFYILPSSLHEVILVPYSRMVSVKQLQSAVQEVNQEQVLPEERLADHIYFYDAGKGTILAL